MNVDVLFRIAAIGILVTVISQILTRAGREDIATMASLSGLVVVLLLVVNMLTELLSLLRAMFSI